MKTPQCRPDVLRPVLILGLLAITCMLLACGDSTAIAPGGNGQTGGGDPVEVPQFLFVGGQNFVRTIELRADGTMSVVGETTVPGVVSPRALTATPNGKYLYVGTDVYGLRGSEGEIALLGFAIDPVTGALSPVAGSPFEYHENPQNLTVTPDGNFLIAMGNGTYRQFSIDTGSGAISETDDLNINENACCTFRRVFDPIRPYFYDITGIGDTVHVLNISDQFGIEDAGFAANPIPAAYIADIAIDPAGRFLYAAENGAGAIQSFQVSDGSLQPSGTPFHLDGSSNLVGPMALDQSGQHLFVAYDGDAASGTTSKIAVLNVDRESGSISMQQPPLEQSIPYARAAIVDTTGSFLLFNTATENGVVGFKIDAATSALTPLPSNASGSSSQANAVVAVRETGR